MQREQLLCWRGMTETEGEHTTSGLKEEKAENNFASTTIISYSIPDEVSFNFLMRVDKHTVKSVFVSS